MDSKNYEIVIIGAGLGGLGMGVSLKKNQLNNFVILEKADEVGGTWRDNTYPGLTVDVPTITYSFSYKQNPNWSTLFAPQPELLDYCRSVADDFGIRPHIHFNKAVAESRFDEVANHWVTTTQDGATYVSRYLITATGFLSTPRMPDIPGLDTFGGKVMHTSSWDHDYDFTGKRVGFIGTGATGIQLIPKIADMNPDQLDVFQRTPIWLLPKPDLTMPEPVKFAFRHIPGAMQAGRLATAAFMDLAFFDVFLNYPRMRKMGKWVEKLSIQHINRQIEDPDVARRLVPDYDWCCKRPSFSNVFYPVFNRDNVDLVTDGIDSITPQGIVTDDGVKHDLDVIVCATGYKPWAKGSMPTYPVYGKNNVELNDYWDENRYQAYHGIAVAGFPNYFVMCGPYSIAHSSYIGAVETSARYISRLLQTARRRNANYVEVKPEAQQREFDDILQRRSKEIFFNGNCAGSNTYYYDGHGDTPNFRPHLHPKVWAESRWGRLVPDFVMDRVVERRQARRPEPVAS